MVFLGGWFGRLGLVIKHRIMREIANFSFFGGGGGGRVPLAEKGTF